MNMLQDIYYEVEKVVLFGSRARGDYLIAEIAQIGDVNEDAETLQVRINEEVLIRLNSTDRSDELCLMI